MRRPYRKLNLDERRILATMLQAKATKTKIAETLGRDRSTIIRWSPEQIAGRLKIEPRATYRICHGTIHQSVRGRGNRATPATRRLILVRFRSSL